jgi:DNA-binding NarL/FixJ family response regulator
MSPPTKPLPNPAGRAPSRPSILVVGAEWITAQDIRQTLADLGYHVFPPVSSAAAALDALAGKRPDLALVDIRLEGPMDGVDLAAELRTKHRVPVVFLTAHADHVTVERLKQTSPNGYVSKPFDEGQLRVAVELALHNAAAERTLLDARAADKARLHELEARTAVLDARLREIAGLVSDQAGEAGMVADPDIEGRLRGLSRREIEIVRLLADGRRVAAISRDLLLSVHTVRNHLRTIFRKLDVHSQEALLDAVRGLPPGLLSARR